MSKCTIRNINFLKSIKKCKKCDLEDLFRKASKDNIKCLTEIARNTLKGNIPYNKAAIAKLKKFKTEIRTIGRKNYSLKKKKQILSQRGGFISALIAPVISAIISGVLSKAISNN